MAKDPYDIECLIKTFRKHAIKAEEFRKKSIKEFKKNFPADPFPEDMQESFNLALALSEICEEIIKLKKGKENG